MFYLHRNVFSRRCHTTQACVSSGLAIFDSITVTTAAVDGISPSNDTECSAQAAIDDIVYMRHGRGSRYKNLHRVRHIEGVCEKFHKGTVRVGFWVGNCASGYKSADAYAGRNSVSRIYVE